MADVTILQQPDQLHPLYNPAYYVVSGTHYASGNYKLLARVADSNNATIKYLKQPTSPDVPQATCFDLHRILEAYVTHTVDLSLNKIERALSNFMPYIVEFGEEYGTPPLEHWDDIYSPVKIGLNVALSPREFLGWSMSDFISGYESRQFLCKYKGTRKVFTTTKAFAYFAQDLNNASSSIDGISVKAYSSSGTLLQTCQINTTYDGTQDDEMVLYCPAGVYNLNQIPTAQLSGATIGNVIPENTAYYDLAILWDSTNIGESIRFEIVENCSKYTNYPIYFLGQYGNVEVWNFNKRSDKTSNITRSTYKSSLGKWTGASYGYDANDRQVTQYDTMVTDSVRLNTDNLTEAECGFLKELVQSPQVWSLEDGELIPIIVRNPNFEQFQKANTKVFNLSIDIEYSSATELQRY